MTTLSETQLREAEKIKWHRVPVDKKIMSELMKKSDWKGIEQLGKHLLLCLITGALAYYSWYHWHWVATVLLIILHGTFYNFLGPSAAIHELSHKTTFKTAALNDFALRLCSFIGQWNHVHYRSSHVKHHQLTLYEGLDLEIVLPLKLDRLAWFWGFTMNIPGFFRLLGMHLRWSFGKLSGDWENRIFPENNPALRRDFFNWSRFILISHGLLLAAFIYFQLWPLIFLVTFGPYIGSWLAILVGFPQHAGLQSSVPDFRLCCRTYTMHAFPAFLYWQMNYHIEHHMYPSVPQHNLKKLHEVLKPNLPPCHHGLLPTWKEILGILKKQKETPSYYYVQPLPESSVKDEIADADQVLREARSEA